MHTALGSRPLVYHSGYCPSKISFCLWICNTTLLIFIPLPYIYTHSTPHVFLSWNINYNSVSWAPDLCSDYLWNSQQWTTTRAQHICWSQVLFDYLNFCYGSITVTTFLNRLLNFSLFNLILSFQTSNHEEIHYKDSLILCPSQTCVCLMANLMPSNLTLFLTVHFHAVHGYAARSRQKICHWAPIDLKNLFHVVQWRKNEVLKFWFSEIQQSLHWPCLR